MKVQLEKDLRELLEKAETSRFRRCLRNWLLRALSAVVGIAIWEGGQAFALSGFEHTDHVADQGSIRFLEGKRGGHDRCGNFSPYLISEGEVLF